MIHREPGGFSSSCLFSHAQTAPKPHGLRSKAGLKGKRFLHFRGNHVRGRLNRVVTPNLTAGRRFPCFFQCFFALKIPGYIVIKQSKCGKEKTGSQLRRCDSRTVELGKEWEDPTKYQPRSPSTRLSPSGASTEGSLRGGDVARRRAGGAECQGNAKGAKGAEGGADADAEMEVDNLAAGGFFGWMGREQLGAGAGG